MNQNVLIVVIDLIRIMQIIHIERCAALLKESLAFVQFVEQNILVVK